MKPSYLLPNKLRLLGIILLVVGICLAIAKYKFNYKPDFLNLKIFAIYSFYIETKTFSVVSNQMIEELAAIFILIGLFLVAFTREKVESELLDTLRLKAFMITAYFNLFSLIFSLLFFFGFGFVGALIFFSVSWLAVYILVLRYLLSRVKI